MSLSEDKSKVFTPEELIQVKYEQDIPEFESKALRLKCLEFANGRAITLEWVRSHRKGLVEVKEPPAFEFQVQATLSSFKFFGCFSGH